jgi:polyisoprenoid-binding protein YceI
MKTKRLLIAMLAVLLFQPALVSAQTVKVKSYKMTVAGTSSLHDWESEVGKLECSASYLIAGNTLTDIKSAVLKIPVQSIKSTKGKIMDNKTYEAFNYEKYPWITFTLSSEKIDASGSTAQMAGTLTMAGRMQAIDVVTTYRLLPNGDLQFTGSKKIKMTEFNMEPPTAMMGTIKVGDEVVVSFNIIFTNTNSTL